MRRGFVILLRSVKCKVADSGSNMINQKAPQMIDGKSHPPEMKKSSILVDRAMVISNGRTTEMRKL